MARSTRYAALVDGLVMRLGQWRMRHPAPAREGGATGAGGAEARSWYRIENAAGEGPATVYLYDEIGMWGVSANDFMDSLREVSGRDLTLRFNSPGGDVFDGVTIYNALSRHNGKIDGQVDGLCASAASFIAMACDTLHVNAGGQLMIHDAIGLCYGNEADALALAGMLGRTSDTIALIYAERAGGDAAEWRGVMRGERWYTGDEAVDAGLADSSASGKRRADPAADPAPVDDVTPEPLDEGGTEDDVEDSAEKPPHHSASQERDNGGRWAVAFADEMVNTPWPWRVPEWAAAHSTIEPVSSTETITVPEIKPFWEA